MPSEWVWTNRRLGSSDSHVFLVYPSDSSDGRLGAMKVFLDEDNLQRIRAKRELLALRTLDGNTNVFCLRTSYSLSETLSRRSSRVIRLPKQCSR